MTESPKIRKMVYALVKDPRMAELRYRRALLGRFPMIPEYKPVQEQWRKEMKEMGQQV